MRIKICGLFRPEDITYANEVRPDYIGFVFARSKRRVSYDEAARLKKMLRPDIQAVGVFVDASAGDIVRCLGSGMIDMVQLHGTESEADIIQIRKHSGKKVIKAVKATSAQDIIPWLESSADYLLFDSGQGSGLTFNWQVLSDITREFFLAGGLAEANLLKACQMVKPFAVDISSGAESAGIKDYDKMKKLTQIVRCQ